MPSTELKTGTVLRSPVQEYKIEKSLGSGSFGITYLATSKIKYDNLSFTAKFAIKEHFMESCFRDENGINVHCTPTSQTNVEQSRKDFINEARRLRDICQSSRNIVKVNETFEANGTAYYVMEYLDGGSPEPMDEKSAVELIRQISEAVDILHKNKLLHLDIKPDNIVLKTSEDGEVYPVLIDFGITKHFDEKGRPTSSPNVKGVSQGYAPIEQSDEIREFAPTLDIYALGATLLYLLTGKNPPSSVKLIDPSQKELKNLIPESVSQQTKEAILHAMMPNKNDRTQTVKAFLMELPSVVESKDTKRVPRKTEPIIKKIKSFTEPLKKRSSLTIAEPSKNKKRISIIIMWLTFILAAIGFGCFHDEIIVAAMLCVPGIFAGIFFSYFISRLTKINWGIIFGLFLAIFVVVCIWQKSYYVILTLIADFILYVMFMEVTGASKNLWRWIVSVCFLGVAAFYGYQWYSDNSLYNNQYQNNTIENDNPLDQTVAPPANGFENGHEYVDLGLPSGTKWATCNIGAVNPEEYGDYFMWGDDFDSIRNSCTYMVHSAYPYMQIARHSVINSEGILSGVFDTAKEIWNGNWRIPTEEDWKELESRCNWIWIDSLRGSKVIGSNGNSIFLPASGWKKRDLNDAGNVGQYWSATPAYNTDSENRRAVCLCFSSTGHFINEISRNFGFSVRPVLRVKSELEADDTSDEPTKSNSSEVKPQKSTEESTNYQKSKNDISRRKKSPQKTESNIKKGEPQERGGLL